MSSDFRFTVDGLCVHLLIFTLQSEQLFFDGGIWGVYFVGIFIYFILVGWMLFF